MAPLLDVVVLLVLIGAAIWLIEAMPLPPPLKIGARVVLGVAGLVCVLRILGVWSGRLGF